MEENSQQKTEDIPCKEIIISHFCFKIFGIPIFSFSKAIHEDELYRRLELKFKNAMTLALHNATKG